MTLTRLGSMGLKAGLAGAACLAGALFAFSLEEPIETELLLNHEPQFKDAVFLSVLPKEPITIVINRINGKLLHDDDVEVQWDWKEGRLTVQGPREKTWQAPAKPGLYPLKMIIHWKDRVIVKTLHAAVLIPLEKVPKPKGKYLKERQKAAKEKVKALDKKLEEQAHQHDDDPGVVLPMSEYGFRHLKFYAQTLPSNIRAARPTSRIGQYREFYLKIPKGMIAVTKENEKLPISRHFTLGDFICKGDQKYPKYVCLDPALIDKLEGLVEELARLNLPSVLQIMSGYRTPWYNKGIGNVKYSRHTYGDASDLFVDGDANGLMDDLNGDKKVDLRDAETLRDVIERVEALGAAPGGIGVYGGLKRARKVRAPFVHMDTRGFSARW